MMCPRGGGGGRGSRGRKTGVDDINEISECSRCIYFVNSTYSARTLINLPTMPFPKPAGPDYPFRNPSCFPNSNPAHPSIYPFRMSSIPLITLSSLSNCLSNPATISLSTHNLCFSRFIIVFLTSQLASFLANSPSCLLTSSFLTSYLSLPALVTASYSFASRSPSLTGAGMTRCNAYLGLPLRVLTCRPFESFGGAQRWLGSGRSLKKSAKSAARSVAGRWWVFGGRAGWVGRLGHQRL